MSELELELARAMRDVLFSSWWVKASWNLKLSMHLRYLSLLVSTLGQPERQSQFVDMAREMENSTFNVERLIAMLQASAP